MAWTTDGSVGKLLAWRLAEDPGHEFLYVEDEGPWTYQSIAAEAVRLHEQLDGHVSSGELVILTR